MIQAAEHIISTITTIFNKILHTENIPDQRKTNMMIILLKNGTKDDLNNYRPMFSKIIRRNTS